MTPAQPEDEKACIASSQVTSASNLTLVPVVPPSAVERDRAIAADSAAAESVAVYRLRSTSTGTDLVFKYRQSIHFL